MATSPLHYCTRCVMDTTDEDIHFDIQGNCNHCTDFITFLQNHRYQPKISEQKWSLALQSIKERGKNKKYDCLVGISGGVDSSYTAHLCKEYGLRPLLMHFDNGWNTQEAKENVKIMVDALGFDFVDYKVDWEEFRQIQLAFLKSSIVDLEIPTDIGILGATYEIAQKQDIPTIISGGNFSAEGILPLTWGYHVKNDMKLYKHIVKEYGNIRLKKVPTAGFLDNFYIKFIKGIKTYYPLNYIDFNKDIARQFLIDTYGFKDYGGKHQESIITSFWQGYVMPTKYNMDLRKATYSSQICSGQLTREDALQKLESPYYELEKAQQDKVLIAQKWGITEQELEKYLQLPPKTYKDFPNQKGFIDFFYKLYFKLKR